MRKGIVEQWIKITSSYSVFLDTYEFETTGEELILCINSLVQFFSRNGVRSADSMMVKVEFHDAEFYFTLSLKMNNLLAFCPLNK